MDIQRVGQCQFPRFFFFFNLREIEVHDLSFLLRGNIVRRNEMAVTLRGQGG